MLQWERVSGKNVWGILSLDVREDQKSFVAPNSRSIIEAYCAIADGGCAFPFGIYHDNEAVGFLLIGYGTDESWTDAPDIAEGNYNIWRFMIDRRFQGRGYGREALGLALEFIAKKPCGDAAYCWLSYEPENKAAKSLYHSFGFRETGEMDGGEIIAALKLSE